MLSTAIALHATVNTDLCCLADFSARESPLFADFYRSSAIDTIKTLMSSTEDLDVDEKNAEEISEETETESSVSTDAAVPFVQNSVTPAVEATDDGFVTGIE